MVKSILLSLLASLFLSSVASSNPDPRFDKTLNPSTLGLKREKLTHLHFFFHDSISGKNPTVVKVAAAPSTNASASFFGFVAMMDDPLTVGPDRASHKIGAAQGIYGLTSQTELALLMVHTYVFTEGKYKGSTLSVLGRNAVSNTVRELAIVGGTGVFRFARGYALSKTHAFNITTLNAILEYDVYIFHY